jgi:hypothetical protein
LLCLISREFVIALSAASVVNRVRLIETLFHIFDLDNDGKITREEIGKMLHTLVDVTDSIDKSRSNQDHQSSKQHEQNSRVDLQQRIEDAFNELNGNDDDHITKDEFIEWYMKSGLIADVQKADMTAADSSRISHIEKKSRKLKKQSSNMKAIHENEESRQQTSNPIRHMSRMTEKRMKPRVTNDYRHTTDHRSFNGSDDDDNYGDDNVDDYDDDNDDNDNSDDDHSTGIHRRSTKHRTSKRHGSHSDGHDSQFSKGNDRWQHLFHSVLGQIRNQADNEVQPVTTHVNENRPKMNKWKRKVEENYELETLNELPNGEINRSYVLATPDDVAFSNDNSSLPDIVSVRF